MPDAPAPTSAAGGLPEGALRRHGPALAAALGGVAFLAWHAGVAFLDPTATGWTYHRDWATAQLAWDHYRRAPPLRFPLGLDPDYPWGLGSTIGYADAIPIVAVPLRLLSPLLPAEIQFLGAWVALCFAAQGFAGAKLAALVTPSRAAQALGGLLFATSPVLAHRILEIKVGHPSLGAQALLLGLIWTSLAPVAPGGAPRRVAGAGALVLATTAIHPYLVLMGLPLALAAVARLALVDRALGPAKAAAAGLAVVAATAAGLWAFGYLDLDVRTPAPGFGYFSADLTALLNPMDWSRLWRGAPVGPGQYEGFAWLGTGTLALLLAGAVTAARDARAGALRGALRAATPVALVAVALFAFALSDQVTFGGRPVLRLDGLYRLLPAARDNVRCTGRFTWPLHALLTLGALGAAARLAVGRPRALAALLGAAVALQVAELRPPRRPTLADPGPPPRHDPAWALARGRYLHLARVPRFLVAGGNLVAPAPDGCGNPPWDWDGWARPVDLAWRLGLTIDSAQLSRTDHRRAGAACAAARADVRARRFDADTIYLVHPSELPWFTTAGATCGVLDGGWTCVAPGRDDPFAAALAARR